MLDSASVNSISSIPSVVYQCKKAFLLNIAVNCSPTLLNISWIAVELPTKVTDIFNPFGGISQIDDLILFGIHSTKYEEFLFWTCNRRSNIFRVLDQKRTSCSWHRTFVESILEQSKLCIVENLLRSMERILP